MAACNADLATTKALRMANEVDQEGERTIGKYHVSFGHILLRCLTPRKLADDRSVLF